MKHIKPINEIFDLKNLIKRKISKLRSEILDDVHYDFDGVQQLSIISCATNKFASSRDKSVMLDMKYSMNLFKRFGILHFKFIQGPVHEHLKQLMKYSDDLLVYKLESIVQIAEDYNCDISYFFTIDNSISIGLGNKRYNCCMSINLTSDALREIINYVDQAC